MKRTCHLATMAALGLLAATGAQAAPRLYTFTASGFQSINGVPAPYSTISGNVTIDDTIVTAIDLTIGSHTYVPSEVEYILMDSKAIVGGKMSSFDDARSMATNTDDFHIWGDFEHLGGWVDFSYSVAEIDDIYSSSILMVSEVSVPVPEPEAYVMLMAGLGVLGVVSRRRMRAS